MEWRHGVNEATECSTEKHQEGGVCGKKKTHNRTFAKICTDRTGGKSRVCG
jgi:hypothetical protein